MKNNCSLYKLIAIENAVFFFPGVPASNYKEWGPASVHYILPLYSSYDIKIRPFWST